MKKFSYIHLLISFIFILFLIFNGEKIFPISYALGSLLSLSNVLLLGMVLNTMFSQKSVALPLGVIVFKYAVLGITIYQVVQQNWLDLAYFSIGLGTIVISAVLYGVMFLKPKVISTK